MLNIYMNTTPTNNVTTTNPSDLAFNGDLLKNPTIDEINKPNIDKIIIP